MAQQQSPALVAEAPSATATVLAGRPLQERLDALWANNDWAGVRGLLQGRSDLTGEQLGALAAAQTNLAPTPVPAVATTQPTAVPRSGLVRTGSEGRLNTTAAVAVTESAMDALTKAAIAKDEVGYTNVFLSGQAFRVEKDTRVLVIDRGGFLGTITKVRVLEGPQSGKAGWVPYEWVSRLE